LIHPPLLVFLNILTIGIRAASFKNSLTTGRKIMDKQGEFTKNGTPFFDGKNYVFWSTRMRKF
jgi:hypothetical protein